MNTCRLFKDIKKYSIYREIFLSSRGKDYKEKRQELKKKWKRTLKRKEEEKGGKTHRWKSNTDEFYILRLEIISKPA